MSEIVNSESPLDITVRFVLAKDALPRDWQECLVYVNFVGDEPAIFYGTFIEDKWIGATPWDSCGDGGGRDCVALEEISGTVVAWAPFPKPNLK